MADAEIRIAHDQAEVALVRSLFAEYGAAVGGDLDFQGFRGELETLPGDYAPPRGALFLARVGDAAVGCAGLRPLGGGACELKRLYVRPGYRGLGLARQLIGAVLDEARRLGFTLIRLDTLPDMVSAQRLYRKLGFRQIRPYRANPVPGAVFMERPLAAPAGPAFDDER